MIKKRCQVCGKRFFTNNQTCSRQCGMVLQKEKCQKWWKENKESFRERVKMRFSTIKHLQ